MRQTARAFVVRCSMIAGGSPWSARLLVRVLVFFAVFGAMQFAWQLQNDGALRHLIIDRGVVVPAAALVNMITPQIAALAIANKLWESNGGLNIVNGCDGMETLFLLIAGLVVAPIAPRGRIVGVLAGVPVIYLLNLVRILVLFYARHRSAELFDLLHGIVTPAVMVLSVSAFYYLWVAQHQRDSVNHPG